MTIAYVNAGTVSTAGGGSNITVALPATITSSNLLLLFAALSGRSFSSVTQGYIQIGQRTTSPAFWVGYKFAGSSETAPVLTASGTMSSGSAVILQYNAVKSFNVPSTPVTVNASSVTTNSLTTTTADELVISLYEGNYLSSNTTFTWTAPGSTTTRVNSAQTSTSNGLLVVDEIKTTAGATTARTATVSSSTSILGLSLSFQELVPNPKNFFMFMT